MRGRKRKHNKNEVIDLLVDMKVNETKRNKLESLIDKPSSYSEVANQLGYTRERVRQIYQANKENIDAQVKEKTQNITI